MAPPADNDAQFRFLISCIRNSTNGKIDFAEVASECDIISKPAAAKRYERLMKAHGIAPAGSPATKKELKEPKATKGTKAGGKKRKLAEVDEDPEDEAEPVKKEVKAEKKGRGKRVVNYEENCDDDNEDSGDDADA